MARTARECGICRAVIDPKYEDAVINLRWKYYHVYYRDIGEPVSRRGVLMCGDCTRWFNKALTERYKAIREDADDTSERLDERQGHRPDSSDTSGSTV